MANFLKGTQNGRFWPKCKGGTLCKNLEIGHFFGHTLKDYKIVNTSRILASLVWMDANFILVCTDTKISMKQQELAEKWQFSKGYSKWAILAKVQRGDPLQKSRNWPFF